MRVSEYARVGIPDPCWSRVRCSSDTEEISSQELHLHACHWHRREYYGFTAQQGRAVNPIRKADNHRY